MTATHKEAPGAVQGTEGETAQAIGQPQIITGDVLSAILLGQARHERQIKMLQARVKELEQKLREPQWTNDHDDTQFLGDDSRVLWSGDF